MMLLPRRRNNYDLWEDMFNDPFFAGEDSKIMKTDIKEKKDKYIVEMDLPGYEKENIKIEIEDGYLNIHASANVSNDEKDDDGEFVRKERYFGECSRSFYVGDDVTEEDIKASFRNGTLKIEIPKKEVKKEIPQKKYIAIDD